MASKKTHQSRGSSAKRIKLAPATPKSKFQNANDVLAALEAQNQDILVQAFTTLRNQLTVKPSEGLLSPQDERLLLVQSWLQSSPGAPELFSHWDGPSQRTQSLMALVVSVFASILTLLSSHYTFHALGHPIMKTILTAPYMRRINSYIGGTHTELILMTLKLLNAMSGFAGGHEKKALLDSFGWEIKSLPKLCNMRRKSKGQGITDPFFKPDIRTLYILFLLSFIDQGAAASVKSAFLEQHRHQFLSIFKGLSEDPYPVMKKVLESCWSGIWSDPKLKRTTKVGLFSEATLSQITKIYQRTSSDDDDPDNIPANVAHHFLLAICTRPGVGICFKDRGWYPRTAEGEEAAEQEEEDADTFTRKGGRIYNKILANFIKALKVNEDLRQQELALKILGASPELVAGYWSGGTLTLEPRLSSKWIANIAIFGSIISLPIPSSTFLLPDSTLYQPSPPPLSHIIENIFPSVNTKAHFSKGLQSSSGLVQHCTAIALAKCLSKYEKVVSLFRQIASTLEENDEEGQWTKRIRDIEREARRRTPDFQVVVAFSQQKFGGELHVGVAPSNGQVSAAPNPTKVALLSEATQRLLWLYRRCLPAVVAEARFDVGKVLQTFSLEAEPEKEGGGGDADDAISGPATKLRHVRQLHVLRLLKDSDQFLWSAKMGSSSQSYLAVLLKAYSSSQISAIKTVLVSLLQQLLSESILFQEDREEPYLWLLSLPSIKRAHGNESPDGALLTDETEAVISFLDHCIQRCLKTPHRYIEELFSTFVRHDSSSSRPRPIHGGDLEAYPSPLLITVLEQLDAKIGKQLLEPSDVLALASFLRKLVVRLSAKQQNPKMYATVLTRIDYILRQDRLFSEHPIISKAVRKEVSLLKAYVGPLQSENVPETIVSDEVEEFISAVETMSMPSSTRLRVISAYELIDWIRLLDEPLGSENLMRVVSIITSQYPAAIKELMEYVNRDEVSLLDVLSVSSFAEVGPYLSFDTLFLHTSREELALPSCPDILVDLAFSPGFTVSDLKRALRLVIYHISASQEDPELTRDLLFLSASILRRAIAILSSTTVTHSLKELVFVQSDLISSYLVSSHLPNAIREGLRRLVRDVLDPNSAADRALAANITGHWLQELVSSLRSDVVAEPTYVTIWVPYFSPADVFNVLDVIASLTPNSASHHPAVLTAIFDTLLSLTKTNIDLEQELYKRLSSLLTLWITFPQDKRLENLIAIAIDSSLPVGCDGMRLVSSAFEEMKVIDVIQCSTARWSRRHLCLPTQLSLEVLLSQKEWSASTVTIVCDLFYRKLMDRRVFTMWLSSEHCARLQPSYIIPVLHAYLDTRQLDISAEDSLANEVWIDFIRRIFAIVSVEACSPDLRLIGESCLRLMLSANISLFTIIAAEVEKLPTANLTLEVVRVGARLPDDSAGAQTLKAALVEHGIQWVIRQLADGRSTLDTAILDELRAMLIRKPTIKPHLVETILSAVIQNRISSVSLLRFLEACLSTVSLKPAVVNRHLQSIIQHPQFFKLCAAPGEERDALISLLHTLFHLHPTNTCQVTHVEPLTRVYHGTLAVADGELLSIFRLFEAERKTSIASLLSHWGPSSDVHASSFLDTLQSLDASLVFRTCLEYPRWRRIDESLTDKAAVYERSLYDPVFLMLVFANMLTQSPPSSAIEWVGFFRTNIVSLLIRALSAKDGASRSVALSQIAALWNYLENADMQEKPHVLHILNLLKDVYPSPSDEYPKRLPSYVTLLLSHALRAVFYPSNFIYPLTSRFLLQRPELDINDVPMLYSMLYSSSDDWKKERGWILRFLSDGMTSSGDWRVLKRRHTWDLLATLFQSSEKDKALRNSIFEVLANLTCSAQAVMSLVLKSGLLTWIEMQLVISKVSIGVEWVKILENIMVLAKAERLEAVTGGEWRSVICRCLAMILEDPLSAHIPVVFPFAASAILRLSSLPGQPPQKLPKLLKRAVDCLERMEVNLTIPHSFQLGRKTLTPTPLYGSHQIHEHYPAIEPLQIWGEGVEALWRVAMRLDRRYREWDALIVRLLIWNAAVGADGSVVGEWARQQVKECIS